MRRQQQRKFRIIVEGRLRGGHEIGHPEQVVHVPFRVGGRTPLHGAEHCERGHQDGDEPDADELTNALPLAPFGRDGALLALAGLGQLPVAFGDASIEEALSGRTAATRWWWPSRASARAGRRAGGTSRPISRDPFTHRLCEAALIAHVMSGAVDPVASRVHSVSNASCEISTVGLLVTGSRSKLSRRWRPNASSTERSIRRSIVELLELALEDSATGVLRPSPKLTSRSRTWRAHFVRFVTETGQQAFGPLDQRAGHPAELLVGGVADPAAAPMVEQLGQRVLQQRQRASAVDDLSTSSATSAGSKVMPYCSRGP